MRRVWGLSPTRSLEEDDPDWDRVRVSSMVSQVYRGSVWRQVVAARPYPHTTHVPYNSAACPPGWSRNGLLFDLGGTSWVEKPHGPESLHSAQLQGSGSGLRTWVSSLKFDRDCEFQCHSIWNTA